MYVPCSNQHICYADFFWDYPNLSGWFALLVLAWAVTAQMGNMHIHKRRCTCTGSNLSRLRHARVDHCAPQIRTLFADLWWLSTFLVRGLPELQTMLQSICKWDSAETNLFWIFIHNQRHCYLRRKKDVGYCRLFFLAAWHLFKSGPFLLSLLFYINTWSGKSLPLPWKCGRALINLTRMICFSGGYLTVAGLQNAPHLKAILRKSPYSK